MVVVTIMIYSQNLWAPSQSAQTYSLHYAGNFVAFLLPRHNCLNTVNGLAEGGVFPYHKCNIAEQWLHHSRNRWLHVGSKMKTVLRIELHATVQCDFLADCLLVDPTMCHNHPNVTSVSHTAHHFGPRCRNSISGHSARNSSKPSHKQHIWGFFADSSKKESPDCGKICSA